MVWNDQDFVCGSLQMRYATHFIYAILIGNSPKKKKKNIGIVDSLYCRQTHMWYTRNVKESNLLQFPDQAALAILSIYIIQYVIICISKKSHDWASKQTHLQICSRHQYMCNIANICNPTIKLISRNTFNFQETKVRPPSTPGFQQWHNPSESRPPQTAGVKQVGGATWIS